MVLTSNVTMMIKLINDQSLLDRRLRFGSMAHIVAGSCRGTS